MENQWKSVVQAANYLGVNRNFLDIRRGNNIDIPYYKIGKRVLYKQIDLDTYIKKCRHDIE